MEKQRRQKNKRLSGAFSATLMLAVVYLLVAFVPMASALEFDNIITETGVNPNTGYPNLEIKNAFGLGETLFEASLSEHTDTCGEDCMSKFEVNHSGGVLIQDIIFKTLVDEAWVEQDIRSYTFKYEAELPEYETECEGANNETCITTQTGTYTGWKYFRAGDEVPVGNYEIYLEGKKKPTRTVDWVIKTQGIWLDEWAVWESNPEAAYDYLIGYPNLTVSSGTTSLGGNLSYDQVFVAVGATLQVNGTKFLNITARNITIEGTVNGAGLGEAGGAGGVVGDLGSFQNGAAGTGTSAGGGGDGGYNPEYGGGGGGGGHVSSGGAGAGTGGAAGTTTYGNQNLDTFFLGSGAGGGGAGNAVWGSNGGNGGAGGASVNLHSARITVSGTVSVAGGNGGNGFKSSSNAGDGGGGGGSGGTLQLNGVVVDISDSTLRAYGGSGGTGICGADSGSYAGGGGGGSGGRIKIISNNLTNTSVSLSYAGGGGGAVTVNSCVDLGDGASGGVGALTYTALTGLSTVTLNSPADDSISGSAIVTFNASASVVGGAFLQNLSLWTNSSGTWAQENTQDTTSQELAFSGTEVSWTTDASWNLKKTIPVNDYVRIVEDWGRVSTSAGNVRIRIEYEYNNGTDLNVDHTGTNPTAYTLFSSPNPHKDILVDDIKVWIGRGASSGTAYEKNTSVLGLNYTSYTVALNDTIPDTTIWNYKACDSDGDCGWGVANYTVKLDDTAPTIDVEAPVNLSNYISIGSNETLNVTFAEFNLDTCWYDYNGTNVTIAGCTTAVKNSTNFVLEYGNTNMTVWANDTIGNSASLFKNWTYKVVNNSNTYNATSFAAKTETFTTNVTANASLTAVKLDYNGTNHTMTDNGDGTWTKSIQVPLANVGANTVKYHYTYGSETIVSESFTQTVTDLIIAQCNGTYADVFANYTFVNEQNESALSGSMPSATFTYHIGDGTVTKTLTMSNTTELTSYTFCSNAGSETITVDQRIQYQSSGYPQRVYDPSSLSWTNSSITSTVLYLLPTADGQYVTFQVVNTAEQLISGVVVNTTRTVGSSAQTVSYGTTDASGAVTLWLNPDFVHAFTFAKSPYTTVDSSFAPTQSAYTITMAGGTNASTTQDHTKGITYSISPLGGVNLYSNVNYTFNFTIASTFWEIAGFGFNLYNSTGTNVGSSSSSANGGSTTLVFNVTTLDTVEMKYYWIINGTYINATRVFLVSNSGGTDWSINNTMTDFRTYLGSGMFGMTNFAAALLVFFILTVSVGVMSYKFGLISPTAISIMIFSIVLFMDVGLNLMQYLSPPGKEHFITIFTGLIMISMLFRELAR